jgi:hypothetical protein
MTCRSLQELSGHYNTLDLVGALVDLGVLRPGAGDSPQVDQVPARSGHGTHRARVGDTRTGKPCPSVGPPTVIHCHSRSNRQCSWPVQPQVLRSRPLPLQAGGQVESASPKWIGGASRLASAGRGGKQAR